MRLWISGPRIGLFRPGVSFNVGNQRTAYQAAPRPQGNFVYVIESANNTVKIGISSNPQSRLSTLQTGSDVPLSLNYVARSRDVYAIEQRAHALLSQHRLQGEWFDCTADAAVAAIHMAGHQTGVAVIGDEEIYDEPKKPSALVYFLTSLPLQLFVMGLLAALFVSFGKH